jgi:hypothetical protein
MASEDLEAFLLDLEALMASSLGPLGEHPLSSLLHRRPMHASRPSPPCWSLMQRAGHCIHPFVSLVQAWTRPLKRMQSCCL